MIYFTDLLDSLTMLKKLHDMRRNMLKNKIDKKLSSEKLMNLEMIFFAILNEIIYF